MVYLKLIYTFLTCQFWKLDPPPTLSSPAIKLDPYFPVQLFQAWSILPDPLLLLYMAMNVIFFKFSFPFKTAQLWNEQIDGTKCIYKDMQGTYKTR